MAAAKTATLTFRIEPGLKEALRAAAEQEHRSIANMVEVMIRDYCGTKGIHISGPHIPDHVTHNESGRQKRKPS